MARKNKAQLAGLIHTVTGIGWANTNQACIYAGITKPTLDNWIADGLRCSRIGRCLRLKYSDIDRYMRKYEVGRQLDVSLDRIAREAVIGL